MYIGRGYVLLEEVMYYWKRPCILIVIYVYLLLVYVRVVYVLPIYS